MRHFAYACLCFLTVLALSWTLPQGYDMAALPPIDKTHIFFSPTLERFIYTEQIRTHDAEAAKKSEGHHADILYKDEKGVYYDRLAFEAALPFLYFRNMEMRGLLPLNLKGQSFDRKAIERARRVMELRARDFNVYGEHCLPLIEAEPGQVALLYPADRFRMTDTEMHFTNADTNEDDDALTERFTNALKQGGFVFPARHVGGNFTTFKPREGGVFLVDAKGQLFHMLRQKDQPVVKKVELPAGMTPRHVLVSESKEGNWLGMIVDSDNRIWLLRQDDFGMVELKNVVYKPETMDCKVIFDPLYLTTQTSDEDTMHAAVFPLPAATGEHFSSVEPFRTIEHAMSRHMDCPQQTFADAVFPFRIDFTSEAEGARSPRLSLSGHLGLALLVNVIIAAAYFFLQAVRRGRRRPSVYAKTAFLAVTGVYGLIPLLLLSEPE